MAVSPQIFPHRKRRPSAGAFIPPMAISDQTLIQSLLILSRDISSLKPLQFLLKRNSLSMIRKAELLSLLFCELLRNPVPLQSPTLLCFEEMYIVLQRIRTLIEDCSNGSRLWLLFQYDSFNHCFHELNAELSILLDIFPVDKVDLIQDVKEIVVLLRNRCFRSKGFVDSKDDTLRRDVVKILDRVKKEIVPDQTKLAEIFNQLGLVNSLCCNEEIESLEEELHNQTDFNSISDAIALIGLVRYAKCVLFKPLTLISDDRKRLQSPDVNIPSDFRCPISLDLMRDPVVVSTGQTYDRESINQWIESGHNTCPKTGQTLAHTELIPNRALKNLIAMWCHDMKIPFENVETSTSKTTAVVPNKAAFEVTKMTVSFLVNELSVSQSMDAANGVVYELRLLAKSNSDSRACIANAGAIPLLVRYLGSDLGLQLPSLQVNAVTTILNLSILEANKMRIVETDGALNGIIEVLRSGATWEAKGNAAATIFSLSGVPAYKKKLGRKARVVKGLLDLAKDGPAFSKRDALVAILNLAGDRETVGRLVEGGVVELVIEVMSVLEEEAVTILEAVVKRGGLVAIATGFSAIKKLALLMREGSDSTRESAAATLVTMCRKGGAEMVAELARMSGIERIIWELMGCGTARAKRKAANLLRMIRRWAIGLDVNWDNEAPSTSNVVHPNTIRNENSSNTIIHTLVL